MSSVDLSSDYLGLQLGNPLVPSASPLARTLDNLKRMEDAGAGAVVLPSLFEEQIEHDNPQLDYFLRHGSYSYAEAVTYFSDPAAFHMTPDQYLEHIRRAKGATAIPIIASLNGSSTGRWIEFAREIQAAGADALELNLYTVPTDPMLASVDIERGYLEVFRRVKRAVTIPVAVKLSPFFTNLPGMAAQLDHAGADGLVLFNRFQQPDVELEKLDVVSRPSLSPVDDSVSLRLPLNWIAILFGRIRADLAGTSGVHTSEDVLKLLLVGATVTMLASELILRGIDRLHVIRQEIEHWMLERNYASVNQMRGILSQRSASSPAVFERVHYVRAISGDVHA
jgi:dihydroorotate dehydrogenase (fumarate)